MSHRAAVDEEILAERIGARERGQRGEALDREARVAAAHLDRVGAEIATENVGEPREAQLADVVVVVGHDVVRIPFGACVALRSASRYGSLSEGHHLLEERRPVGRLRLERSPFVLAAR